MTQRRHTVYLHDGPHARHYQRQLPHGNPYGEAQRRYDCQQCTHIASIPQKAVCSASKAARVRPRTPQILNLVPTRPSRGDHTNNRAARGSAHVQRRDHSQPRGVRSSSGGTRWRHRNEQHAASSAAPSWLRPNTIRYCHRLRPSRPSASLSGTI